MSIYSKTRVSPLHPTRPKKKPLAQKQPTFLPENQWGDNEPVKLNVKVDPWQLNYLSLCLSIHVSIYLYLSIPIYVSISIHLFLYISPSLSIHLSIYWQKSSTRVAILLSFSCFTSSCCNPISLGQPWTMGTSRRPQRWSRSFPSWTWHKQVGGNSLNRIGGLASSLLWVDVGRDLCFDVGTHGGIGLNDKSQDIVARDCSINKGLLGHLLVHHQLKTSISQPMFPSYNPWKDGQIFTKQFFTRYVLKSTYSNSRYITICQGRMDMHGSYYDPRDAALEFHHQLARRLHFPRRLPTCDEGQRRADVQNGDLAMRGFWLVFEGEKVALHWKEWNHLMLDIYIYIYGETGNF